MPMEVKIRNLNGVDYIKLPFGWKKLVEGKLGKKMETEKVAMEVNTILKVFPIVGGKPYEPKGKEEKK